MVVNMTRNIMTIENAGILLQDMVKENSGNLKNPKGFLIHSKDSSEIMEDLLDKVFLITMIYFNLTWTGKKL